MTPNLIPIDRYRIIDNYANTLILVDVNKLYDRVSKDDPYNLIKPDNPEGSNADIRIKNSIDRINSDKPLTPIIVTITNNKFGILDGRHRLAALKKLGYTHSYIEVPKHQKFLFKKLT